MKFTFGAWRPPTFETAEEMQEKIVEYFEEWRDTVDVIGQYWTTQVPVLTITWLSLFLWFQSRQSFYDYENPKRKWKEFAYTIKRARAFIESEYEKQLQRGNTTGAIFALKNFGWKDTQTHEWEVNNNWTWKFLIEHKYSKYENIDKDWNVIEKEEKKSKETPEWDMNDESTFLHAPTI